LEVKRDILWRVYLCFIALVVLSAAILGRAFYIQQVEGAYWRGLGDSLHQRVETLDAERGTIYSEDGSMLSTSVPQFDIYVDFGAEGLREKGGKRFHENIDSLSFHLAKLFQDQSAADYKRQLKLGFRQKNRYYALKKKVSFAQYQQLRNFPLVRLGRYKSGFIVDVHTKRLTPFGLLANRTIGLARENASNVGLELTYDSILRGTTGQRLVRQIAGGAFAPIDGTEIEPEKGRDVVTTLDVNIQDIAENALLKMLIENEAVHGTCIVMEVKTGKIKAIANLSKQPDGSYWESFNHAITPSEPGSTFKLATMLAVLEDGYVNLNSQVNLEGGTWKVGKRTVYDSEKHGRNLVSVQQAFELSSNVGMAKLALQHYGKQPKKFVDRLKKLRFHEYHGAGLIVPSRPVVKDPSFRSWSNTTLPWMSFGYEVTVSPLQTLMLYNAVANNGKMMKPYLVNRIERDGILLEEIKPTVLEEQICSPETLKQLRKALEGVVTNGTARSLWSPYFTIAGKTGTALVANGNRGYSDHIYQSSFAGYFPADDPQYSCIVVIRNKPHALRYYGGVVAGPVFREIADKLFTLNIGQMISKKKTNGTAQKSDSLSWEVKGWQSDLAAVVNHFQLPAEPEKEEDSEWGELMSAGGKTTMANWKVDSGKSTMPDLRGVGIKDALYLMENKGCRVKVIGNGKLIEQSIPPGAPLKRGSGLVLTFR